MVVLEPADVGAGAGLGVVDPPPAGEGALPSVGRAVTVGDHDTVGRYV